MARATVAKVLFTHPSFSLGMGALLCPICTDYVTEDVDHFNEHYLAHGPRPVEAAAEMACIDFLVAAGREGWDTSSVLDELPTYRRSAA